MIRKIFLIMLLLCSNAFAAITDGKFGINQIFDVQYNWSGSTLNASNFIAPYNKNFQTVTVTSGQYFQFFSSTTNPGTYGLKLMNSDGTQHSIVHDTGDITALGSGAIFYIGSGFFGNVITTAQGYSYGASASFTNMDTSVTSSDLSSYTYASTTPLAAGQTAPAPTTTTTTTAPKYITATNIGFETGNTNSWTISNTSGAANWSAGSGAAIVTGLQHTPGSGKSWTVTPYGSYMLSLQPGSGSPTFDSATTSLGLTSAQNTAIKNLLIQQAQANGGDPTPTNAAWTKRDVTLQAGVTYKIAWQYLSTDYTPFNDGSIITLVHKTDGSKVPTLNNAVRNYALLGFTNPGTGDYSTSSYGSTGWQIATFTVPADGDYSLGFAVFNLGDTALSPILLIDEQPGTTLLNGQPFASITPNPGSGAPSATDGGGGSPTVVSTNTSNNVSSSSTSSNTSSVSVTRPTNTNTYTDTFVGTTTVTTTTTTPVTTTTYSDGSSTTSNGTSTSTTSTSYVVTPTYGTVPTYSRTAPNTGGNSVYIKQVYAGNNPQVSVTQEGNNNAVTGTNSGWATVDGNGSIVSMKQYGQANIIGLKMNAWGNNLDLKQQAANGGDVNNNILMFESAGNGNASTIQQQSNNNTVSVKMTYDINTVNVTQKNGTNNQSYSTINGNWNTVSNTQDGSNNLMLVNISGDNNTASVNQTGSGHITLLNLIGNKNSVSVVQTGANDTYSLQQTCTNPAGCSVSVIRNK